MLSVTPSIAARRSASRRAFAVLAAVMVAFATLVSTAPQATAANYLYWSYWQQTAGKWAFSSVGADKATPSDGAVEGWRWAIDDGNGSRPPRVLPTFAQLCASTPAEAGKKRVGLVVDFGREVDGDGKVTPPSLVATCALVPTAATGADLLAKAGGVRTDKGLICAIGGYPATGCAAQLETLTEAQKAPDTALTLPTAAPTTAPTATTPVATTTPTTTAATPTATATAAVVATSTTAAAGGTSPLLWVLLFVAAAGIAYAVARRRRPSGV